ncbi:MAG: alpha/beta fold hydrolase [Negativicutes bacterium]|nr:alpha/beta fold hydrolase [Negativicutes bacterium]
MSYDGIDLPGGQAAVVLIHGLTGGPFELNYLAKKLNKAGYTVRVPLLAGHGTTISELKTTCWQDWYISVKQTILGLKAAGNTVYVGGLCMGAVLALHAAYELPESVQGVVAMSTTLRYDGWSIPWYSFLLTLNHYTPARYLYSYPEREPYGIKNERLRRIVHKGMKDNTLAYDEVPGVSIRELYRLANTVKRELPAVKTPTLILHSREDDTASVKNADYIEHHIGAAYVRKMLLTDSYHMITIDNQKDLVADEIIAFLEKVAPQEAS